MVQFHKEVSPKKMTRDLSILKNKSEKRKTRLLLEIGKKKMEGNTTTFRQVKYYY